MAIALQNPSGSCMPPPKFIADRFHSCANMRQKGGFGKIFFIRTKKQEMEIQHKEGPNRGLFFIENNGKRMAALSYDKAGDVIIIEHTEVNKSLRGQNIGYELVNRTTALAREKGLKVSPVCPFAKAQFEKNPAWGDLLV
jgi:uncharacterized protein